MSGIKRLLETFADSAVHYLDIRSIEFEIRLLSGAKTVVQHGKLGSATTEHKDRSLGSAHKSMELPASGASQREREDALHTVKRNLLSVYSEGAVEVSRHNDHVSRVVLKCVRRIS